MERARRLYMGEYHSYDRLERLIQEVEASPLVNQTRVGALQQVSGRFGDYTVTFAAAEGEDQVDVQSRGHHRRPGLGARPSTPGTRP